MKVNAKAIATIVRLRNNGFEMAFFDESNVELGVLCIAEKGDAVFCIYPDGSVDEHYYRAEDEAEMSWHDECREAATL